MKPVGYLLILLLMVSFSLSAKEDYNANWWKTANGYYTSKQYDSALVYYEKIAALSPDDAVVYYNLGNTHYRLNQIGPAILNYEKVLKLKPSYKEAADNLQLAKSRIPNMIAEMEPIFFVKWWQSLTSASKATIWAVLSLVLFLGIIGLMLSNKLGKAERMPKQLLPSLATVWFAILLIAMVSAARSYDSGEGVVMQGDAPLLNEPEKGKIQSLVPEGTTVDWQADAGTWVEVKLPDGREGYMRKEHLAKI